MSQGRFRQVPATFEMLLLLLLLPVSARASDRHKGSGNLTILQTAVTGAPS
jgi:hypothetical protein